MCTTGKWKTGILVIAMALACGTANAQHWHRHYHYHPHRVITVVTRPKVMSCVSNCFNQKERLAMSMAYLETNKYLTVKQYAKMTQLSKASAEAELDAFVMDKNKPVKMVIRGKKKVYIKNN